MAVERDGRPRVLDVVVFLDELLLLAVLATAGAGLGSATAVRVVLGIAFPVVAALAWGRWLAPRAPRRLAGPAAFVAKLGLFTVAAALLALAGSPWWALAFWAFSAAALTSAEVSSRRTATAAPPGDAL
jgi:hypothetical protein